MSRVDLLSKKSTKTFEALVTGAKILAPFALVAMGLISHFQTNETLQINFHRALLSYLIFLSFTLAGKISKRHDQVK